MRTATVPTFAVAAGLVVVVLIGLRPAVRRRFSARWIRDQRAPITPELAREVEDTRWLQRLGGLVGFVVGLFLALPAQLRFDPADDESMNFALAAWLIPIGLFCVGQGISALALALREVRGPVRVARTWEPRISDYVSPAGLTVMRIELGIAMLAGIAATQLPRWSGNAFEPRQLALVWSVLAIVALIWVGGELVGRRLVAKPLPSGDATTLYWRDALRGESLRRLFPMVAWLGYLVPMVISQALPRTYGTPAAGIGPALDFAVSMTILIMAFTSMMLLNQQPKGRHTKALLVAAQRETQVA